MKKPAYLGEYEITEDDASNIQSPPSVESNKGADNPRSSSITSSDLPSCRVDDILKKVEQQLENRQHVEDAFDVSGKNIAHKLRRLPPEIAVVTEKLLMDILFEAHLGNVDKYSKINISNSQQQRDVLPQNRNMQPRGIHGYIQQPTTVQGAQQTSEISQGFYGIHNQQFESTQSYSAETSDNSRQCSNTRSYYSTFLINDN